ncbi:MAG: cytochrome c biogenesis protein CcsA [Candidatus Poseidoniia archaeon]|jgi:heme exporter protein C|nr:cytochrome c biogenesis protein CcsA [Candidatus Poseidoniia archaeon]MDP6534511.1 cytochrome c biogenesis protein CcsA [Candidatus Poseidoniia archaeon]MDP6834981.1 cytochrome c biogenesis protein CcsA [Candidatus Poseidoniia archaeon]HIH78910.1 cytochrome c biogenesis protein CcsA [Candidatus Poseidoniia archaeon]
MKSQTLTSAFGGAGFALVLLTLWQGLLVLPPARFFTAPNAQRLFYLHVPSGIMAYLAFMLVVAGSAWWLWQRDQRGDRLARCAAELGVVFGAMSLASGTFWMRAEWGPDIVTRFFSDMRLATTLAMWLLLVSYITWRRQPDSETVRRGAAIIGMLGAISVPLSYLSSRFLRSNHPVIVGTDDQEALAPEMRLVLYAGLMGFLLLFIAMLRTRLELERMQEVLLAARLKGVA